MMLLVAYDASSKSNSNTGRGHWPPNEPILKPSTHSSFLASIVGNSRCIASFQISERPLHRLCATNSSLPRPLSNPFTAKVAVVRVRQQQMLYRPRAPRPQTQGKGGSISQGIHGCTLLTSQEANGAYSIKCGQCMLRLTS